MKISAELYEELKEIDVSRYTEDGLELPNPVPHTVHTGLDRPLTLAEQVARILRTTSLQAQQQGYETVEEADDLTEPEDSVLPDDTKYTVMEQEQLEIPVAPEPVETAPVEPVAPDPEPDPAPGSE